MGTSLVKLITEHPNTLRKVLAEQARLQRIIEELEEKPDPDIDENEDREIYKPNFEQNRDVVRLEAKIDKCKIKLQEAEGQASQIHRNVNFKATLASMAAAEDTDEKVIKIRTELADLNEQRKILEIDAKEGEWIRRNESGLHNNHNQTDRDRTKQEKQLEKARLDLEKVNADIEALGAQFEGYKLLVAMSVTEI